MKSFLSVIIVSLSILSCDSQKYLIRKDQLVYYLDTINCPDNSEKTYIFNVYKTTSRIDVKKFENLDIQLFDISTDQHSKLTLLNSIHQEIKAICESVDDPSGQYVPSQAEKNLLNKYYFPESRYKTWFKISGTDTIRHIPIQIKLKERAWLFQPLTFLYKLRPKLNLVAGIDSFPSFAESNINVGYSFGKRISNLNIRETPNFFNEKRTRGFTRTYGVFLNFGTTDITKTNTRNASVITSHKAPVISPGIFISLGVNRFNIGYGSGIDFAIDAHSSEWIYQEKIWHGLILAFDISVAK